MQRTMKAEQGVPRSALVALSGLLVLALAACGGRATSGLAGTDSESHFLAFCVPGTCAPGLECVFGLCTLPCEQSEQCSDLSAQATCETAGPEDSGVLACELRCEVDAECTGAGLSQCLDGACREVASSVAKKQDEGCATDADCVDGLRCLGSACTTTCESDSECASGGTCINGNDRRGVALQWCEEACTLGSDPRGPHQECDYLGPQGRCMVRDQFTQEGSCKQVAAGSCEETAASGGEWRCFEDIAESVLEERAADFPQQEVCFRPLTTTRRGVTFSACTDQVCANGSVGCPLTGFELQSFVTSDEIPVEQGRSKPLVQLMGELVATAEVPPIVVELTGDQQATCLLPVEGYTLTTRVGAAVSQSSRSGFTDSGMAIPAVLHGVAGIGGGVVEGSARSGGLAEEGTYPEDSACALLAQSDPAFRFVRALRYAVDQAFSGWSSSAREQLECRPCGEIGCEVVCLQP